jgi:hypothetical protein
MLTLPDTRAVRTAVAVLVMVALTACSGGGTAGAGSTGAVAPQGGTARGQQVLAQSAAEVRRVVNSLSAPASGRQPPYIACPSAAGSIMSTTPACTGFDTAGPCVAGAADQAWPQRWGYNVNLQLGKDALDSGTAALTTLANAHWTTRKNPATTFVQDFSASLNGVSMRVVADDLPGVLSFESYGPCINPDGTVRAS